MRETEYVIRMAVLLVVVASAFVLSIGLPLLLLAWLAHAIGVN